MAYIEPHPTDKKKHRIRWYDHQTGVRCCETFTGTSYYLNYYSSGRTTYSTFANSNTIPKPGEIYLWYDSGSII